MLFTPDDPIIHKKDDDGDSAGRGLAIILLTFIGVALLTMLVLALLAGCASTLQQAQQQQYGLERAVESAYVSVWVGVYRGALPADVGETADRLYRTVYYPAKTEARRYLAQWEASGVKPSEWDIALTTIRLVRAQLDLLKETD